MNLQVELPETLVRQVNDLAEKQHVSVNQIVATALTARCQRQQSGPASRSGHSA